MEEITNNVLEKRKDQLKKIGFQIDDSLKTIFWRHYSFTDDSIMVLDSFSWAQNLKLLKKEIEECLNSEIKAVENLKEVSKIVEDLKNTNFNLEHINKKIIEYPCKLIEPNNIYHSSNGFLSSTTLKEYKRSPMHAKHKMLVKLPQTPAMVFGSAYHTLILEPENFDKEYVIIDTEIRPEPDMNMNSKANKRWRENIIASNLGKDILKKEDYLIMLEMKKVLMSNRNAVTLLCNGISEQSFYFEVNGVKCKVRPDHLTKRAITDLKTCENSSPNGFAKQCAEYGYHISAAMYRIGIASVEQTEQMLPFYFVAQEKTEPYSVGIYLASKEFIFKGEEEFYQLLETHKNCVETNQWLGYESFSDNPRGILTVDLPNWYK